MLLAAVWWLMARSGYGEANTEAPHRGGEDLQILTDSHRQADAQAGREVSALATM